jgi:hypothetical protein
MAKDAIPEIRSTSAIVKAERPMLAMSNRWDYLSKWLMIWKIGLRHRGNAYLLFAAGVYFLFSVPALAMVCFGGAAYSYQIFTHIQVRAMGSSRSIMWAH